jgi:hypothetical protein
MSFPADNQLRFTVSIVNEFARALLLLTVWDFLYIGPVSDFHSRCDGHQKVRNVETARQE